MKIFHTPLVVTLMAVSSVLSLGQEKKEEKPVIEPTLKNVKYGPHSRNVLDFWQAEGKGPRPLLVFIHGGSWLGGNKEMGWEPIQVYLENGISCASINYRFTSGSPLPAPVYDAARAIQFLRSKAGEWNLRKDRVCLQGPSAGGCTSMWLNFHDELADPDSDDPVLRESTRVQGTYNIAGQVSIDPRVIEPWLGPEVLKHPMISNAVGKQSIESVLANYDKYKDLYVEFSPYNHVTKDDPPIVMHYGDRFQLPSKDPSHGIHHVEYGKKMKEKCDEVGVECYHYIKNGPVPEKYPKPEDFIMSILLAD